jgi:hypothetical protein
MIAQVVRRGSVIAQVVRRGSVIFIELPGSMGGGW